MEVETNCWKSILMLWETLFQVHEGKKLQLFRLKKSGFCYFLFNPLASLWRLFLPPSRLPCTSGSSIARAATFNPFLFLPLLPLFNVIGGVSSAHFWGPCYSWLARRSSSSEQSPWFEFEWLPQLKTFILFKGKAGCLAGWLQEDDLGEEEK